MNRFLVSLPIATVILIGSAFPPSTHAASLPACDEASLHAAVALGGTIQFGCDGIIVLTNTLDITNDVTLDANGHQVTLSGGGAVRLFTVSTNTSLTLLHLTLIDGRAFSGAGILNEGGSVALTNCTMSGHAAAGEGTPVSSDGDSVGGAILNRGGVLTADSCLFLNNVARGRLGKMFIVPEGGLSAFGGAVANRLGEVTMNKCLLAGNLSGGGNGANSTGGFSAGPGGWADGGALWSEGGSIEIIGCQFENNQAVGGNAGTVAGYGGNGRGGALSLAGSRLNATNTLFLRNEAKGGTGPLRFGGFARGGAVACDGNSSLGNFVDCSFAENRASSGFPGGLANALGGALFNAMSKSTLYRVTFSSNSALGAAASNQLDAGPASIGEGGAIYNTGAVMIAQSTLAGNAAVGGAGTVKTTLPPLISFAAGGDGIGGAIRNYGFLSLSNTTVANNRAIGGAGAVFPVNGQTGPSGAGWGGGIYSAGGYFADSIVVAYNTGSNCAGSFIDESHNISSDFSCGFTNSHSQNGSDPLLGPLTDNGGPTLTMALLPGSPAINAGSEANCSATDQRGVTRPAHGRCDIGAYELVLNEFRLTSIARAQESVQLLGWGPPGGDFSILGSSRFEKWESIAHSSVKDNALFEVTTPSEEPHRFFRIGPP